MGKVVLILMWLGTGRSDSPAIAVAYFENHEACQRAAETFTHKGTWNKRWAFCQRDEP